MSKMDYKIADLMEKYGGDFAKALAECIRRADPVNRMKLRECFPALFQTYHPSQWLKQEKAS